MTSAPLIRPLIPQTPEYNNRDCSNLPNVILSPESNQGNSYPGAGFEWPFPTIDNDEARKSIAFSESFSIQDEKEEIIEDGSSPSSSLDSLNRNMTEYDGDFSLSWWDCCMMPMSWISRVIYGLGFLYGIISLLLILLRNSILPDSLSSNDTWKLIFSDFGVATYLFLVAILAVYEIQVLGTIFDIIECISNNVKNMSHNVIRLQVDISRIQQLQKSMTASVDQVQSSREMLRRETGSSCSSVSELRAGINRVIAENKELEVKLANIMRKNIKLKETTANYEKVVDETSEQISKFSRLRGSICRVTKKQMGDRSDALEQYHERLDRMNHLKRYQQRLILQQISYRSEFRDHQVGFSRREFTYFMRMLPAKFSKIAKAESSWTFDQLSGSDGTISREIIDEIIDHLVESYEDTSDGSGAAFV